MKLAKYIKNMYNIEVNVASMFDIQVAMFAKNCSSIPIIA